MVGNMAELADILYCKIRCLPMTYLSVPFGPSFKVKSVWHPILFFLISKENFIRKVPVY